MLIYSSFECVPDAHRCNSISVLDRQRWIGSCRTQQEYTRPRKAEYDTSVDNSQHIYHGLMFQSRVFSIFLKRHHSSYRQFTMKLQLAHDGIVYLFSSIHTSQGREMAHTLPVGPHLPADEDFTHHRKKVLVM